MLCYHLTISLEPILWLPMTRIERNHCIRWHLVYFPTQIHIKKHVISYLNMYNQRQIPRSIDAVPFKSFTNKGFSFKLCSYRLDLLLINYMFHPIWIKSLSPSYKYSYLTLHMVSLSWIGSQNVNMLPSSTYCTIDLVCPWFRKKLSYFLYLCFIIDLVWGEWSCNKHQAPNWTW